MSDTAENKTLQDFGSHLRGSRQSVGLSVVELAKKTRIPLEQVEALENGQMVNLPPVTLKGFIKAYAVEVGLDPVLTTNEYSVFLQETGDTLVLKPSFKGAHKKESSFKTIGLALILIILAGMVVAGFYAAPYFKEKVMAIVNPGSTSGSPAELAAGRSENAAAETVAEEAPSPPVASPASPMAAGPANGRNQPALTAENVELKLIFKKETWVQTVIDGGPLEHHVFTVGQEKTWVGRESIMVRLGNAGAVEAFYGGKKMPAWGPEGRVVEKLLSRQANLS